MTTINAAKPTKIMICNDLGSVMYSSIQYPSGVLWSTYIVGLDLLRCQ